jgi:peptidoglycan hydrolase CwlO-like protein
MNPLALFQMMSVTAAVFLIIALLLVAGLIGYLTAWYYAKSVYTPVIKKLEDEKAQLNRDIERLRDEVSRLKGKIEDLNKKVDELDKDVSEKEREISAKVDIITGLENEITELKKKLKV